LAIVAPNNPSERYTRGELVGGLIDQGAPEALTGLALVEPVVVTIEQLAAIGVSVKGEPLFVAIHADGTFTPVDLPRNERNDQAAAALAAATIPNARAVAARSASARLTREERERLTGAGKAGKIGELPRDLVERGAATLLAAADTPETRRALGSAAKMWWRTTSVPGSRWAHSQGCSYVKPRVTAVDEEASVIGCGMGSMESHESRRFIRLYAKEITKSKIEIN
jgi:hypothetical protein